MTSIGRPTVLLLLAGAWLAAQTPAPASGNLKFEVASIRSAEVPPQGQVNIGFHVDGAQFRINSMTLKDIVAIAYQLKISQVFGPDWISNERYAIAATIPEGGVGHEREMLQALITERFKLKVHREKKEYPVYALLVGKGPLKLKETPADADDPDPQGTTTVAGGGSAAGVGINLGHGSSYTFVPNRVEVKKLSMPQFASVLERFADRTVVDMTDLKGRFDFGFDINADDYQPMLIRAAVAAGVSLPPQALRLLDNSSSAALADAVAQTGLKLEARKAPLDVIVVDDALKTPEAN